MSEITRVGADLAKRVIQVRAVDSTGKLVTNRALPRDKFIAWCAQLPPGGMVAMEPSSSAHHWARKLIALGLDARINAAHLVAPYRVQGKSGKNDANDAAAICEAASRPADALGARQERATAKHAVRAPSTRRLQARAHRVRQSHPRVAGRVWRSGGPKPQGFA